MKPLLTPLLAALLLTTASAYAVTASDKYGEAVDTNSVQRTVIVDSNTRYINVNHGDTVLIRDGDKSVKWFFDGLNLSFPLSTILPSAAGEKPVRIYVTPENLD